MRFSGEKENEVEGEEEEEEKASRRTGVQKMLDTEGKEVIKAYLIFLVLFKMANTDSALAKELKEQEKTFFFFLIKFSFLTLTRSIFLLLFFFFLLFLFSIFLCQNIMLPLQFFPFSLLQITSSLTIE